MIRVWPLLKGLGAYIPSRPPGFPIPELVVGVASQFGGSLASNAVSALLACAGLACFHRLLLPGSGPARALLATAAAGFNPQLLIAASSSIDYVYGAAFFLMALLALTRDRPYLAALAFAAAAASRLTYAPAAPLAMLAYACLRPAPPGASRLRPILPPAALFLALSVAAYCPSYAALGDGMFRPTFEGRPAGFLSLDGLESPAAYLYRFLYKNALFWGPWACIAMAAGLAWTLRARRRRPPGVGAGSGDPAAGSRGWLWPAVAGFLYFQAVFFRLPLETGYLLPTLFLGLAIADRLAQSRLVLALVLAGQVAHAAVRPEILDRAALEPDPASRASGFTALDRVVLRPHWRPGIVVEDLRRRKSAEVRGWERQFLDAMSDDAIPDRPR